MTLVLVGAVVTGLITLLIAQLDDDDASSVTAAANSTVSPSPAAAPSSAPPTGDPIRVTRVSYVPKRTDFTWVHESALSQQAVDELNRTVESAGGLRGADAAAAMRKAGAVEAVSSTVQVELEGNHDGQVRIVGARAKLEKCTAPLDGTLFYAPPQGAHDVVKLGFDLDNPNLRAQHVKPDPNDGRPHFYGDYFADQKYTLRRYEQVTFGFTARTFEQSCEYRYVLELIVDGEQRTMTIDDHGEPFRVSALLWQGDDRSVPPDCPAYDEAFFAPIFGGPYPEDGAAPWISAGQTRWRCE